MAKFKEGDKVTDGNAVYVITDVDDGIYEWKFVSGKADPSHSDGGEIAWAEGKMRLANSAPVRSTNAVVQNAINARRARNYTRDTEAFHKRKELETQLTGLVQKFINDIKAVGRKAASEYARLKKTDPEAFWVREVTGWVESLEDAINDAW